MQGCSRQNKTNALSAQGKGGCLCVFGIYFYFLILLAIEKDSKEPLILLAPGAVYLSSVGTLARCPGLQVSSSSLSPPAPPSPPSRECFGELSCGLRGWGWGSRSTDDVSPVSDGGGPVCLLLGTSNTLCPACRWRWQWEDGGGEIERGLGTC